MNGNYTTNLALYLIALSLIQGNQRTHVNHEITQALEVLQHELKLK